MTQMQQIYTDFFICENPKNLRHLRAKKSVKSWTKM